MKTSTLLVSIFSMVLTAAAWPQAGSEDVGRNDELAVWQAMGETIARENASRPYKLLYFRSDFGSASFVSSSMADPDRDEFCGISRPAAEAIMGQLMVVNANSVELDRSIADRSKLKFVRRKERTMKYVAMSRVAFDAGRQRAWLAVDLSGGRGGIMRFDKVGGAWNWNSRCAAWVKPRTGGSIDAEQTYGGGGNE